MPLLGALGNLQFEVLQYRLREEYGVETELEVMPWNIMRWTAAQMDKQKLQNALSYNGVTGLDGYHKQIVLFENSWRFQSFKDKNPEIELIDFLKCKRG